VTTTLAWADHDGGDADTCGVCERPAQTRVPVVARQSSSTHKSLHLAWWLLLCAVFVWVTPPESRAPWNEPHPLPSMLRTGLWLLLLAGVDMCVAHLINLATMQRVLLMVPTCHGCRGRVVPGASRHVARAAKLAVVLSLFSSTMPVEFKHYCATCVAVNMTSPLLMGLGLGFLVAYALGWHHLRQRGFSLTLLDKGVEGVVLRVPVTLMRALQQNHASAARNLR